MKQGAVGQFPQQVRVSDTGNPSVHGAGARCAVVYAVLRDRRPGRGRIVTPWRFSALETIVGRCHGATGSNATLGAAATGCLVVATR